ncbi:ammonium transporter [Reinekea marinisedimentorum]|uniref:Amt family ammonium transporter n=1 Tax=Reinekea marinisedimentorum TaxID=230495 RepID=A0A4R3HZR6_9GAMM|nr:ammonium transporter [Reinekea marinisedimentorum]TCS38193.1 Amt family ammonium transporter [Reinekea marinisedimentorum]
MEDYSWLLVSAFLVFVMQAGFLCLETGRVRSKNNINVAAKNLADFILSILCFWLFGFAIMFGDSFFGIFGHQGFFFDGNGAPWNISFFVFQVMFCGTATTLMSGAVAERMSFIGYLLCALVLSGLIYPVTGHWAWSGVYNSDNPGWLEQLGFVDFAGSMVVHGVGGWIALITVIIIGPRLGRFDKGVTITQGSNLTISALGTMLLWFGWFGFNGGSTLVLNAQVPVVILNTCLAAAWGGLAAVAIGYYRQRYIDVPNLMNGVIAGLVAITACCHVVSTADAMIIGLVAGVIVYWGELWIERMRIDDALGVVPAHLFAGVWGVLAVALFGDLDTIGTGLGRLEQLAIQLLGIVAISAWCIGVGYPLLRLVNRWVPLRVSAHNEQQGMNVSEHRAASELLDLLTLMKHQQDEGDFSHQVPAQPFTEVGEIAGQYNRVIQRVNQEISARDDAIGRFRSSEQRKSAILDSSMDAIITLNPDGNIVEFNTSAERIFGCSKRHIQGRNFIDSFVLPEDRDSVRSSLKHHFVTAEGLLLNRRNSLTLMRSSGNHFPAEITITGAQLSSPTKGEFILSIRDVTRQRKLQEKLRQLAYSDPLTGLYNRTYLIEQISKMRNGLAQSDETLAVFFLDLDKFKRINDTLGHKAGDDLLCEVSVRLARVTREDDVIARWGGDEFIVLMKGQLSSESIAIKAMEILEVMRDPIELEGHHLSILTSIGIAQLAEKDQEADAFIQQADIAMYQAKMQGPGNYRIFATEMADRINRNFRYEQDLKNSLETELFSLVYQAKVKAGGSIVGLEALCRWQHPDDGMVPPDEFISLAEESNLILALSEQVFHLALSQLARWREAGIRLVPVSINVSGRQLLSESFVPFLHEALLKYGIEGRLLELEITEGVLVSDIDRCIEVLSKLKALGVAISVDDFGTGYSSLSYLKRLPIDVLKIDRSFIEECDSVSEDAKICETIINLARNLELTTVAEGVETQSQLAFLQSHGCDLYQGYYFHRPLPAAQVKGLLDEHGQLQPQGADEIGS